STALDALREALNELHSQGITLAFARVRDEVREDMRLAGIEAVVGPENFYDRVTDGVRAWREAEANAFQPRTGPGRAPAGRTSSP
ncbi:MAG: sodium-independent anion transporter, partial [Reyranella sp.]|nr:sodium-independent anion transporter [Reyranella sp.]